jgi:hypothetical protein
VKIDTYFPLLCAESIAKRDSKGIKESKKAPQKSLKEKKGRGVNEKTNE